MLTRSLPIYLLLALPFLFLKGFAAVSLSLFLLLIDVLFIFSRSRQCLHDRLLGTSVEYLEKLAKVQTDKTEEKIEHYELAGRGRRLGAALLNLSIYLSPLLLLFVIGFLTQGADSMQNTLAEGSSSGLLAFLFPLLTFVVPLVIVVLNLVWLHRYGQSIGKRLLGIKIIRTDGSRSGLRHIVFVRNLPIYAFSLIPILGQIIVLADLLFIFQASRQCLHDKIADTVVIRVPPASQAGEKVEAV